MSRIGIDGRELIRESRTGIGRYLREVLRAGAHLDGVEFVLYGNGSTWIEPGLGHVEFRALPGTWTQWWDQVTLPRQLSRDRITVFLSPYYKGPLVAPCPVVLTIHDLLFIHYPGRRRPFHGLTMSSLARLYAHRATAIIADSEHSKRSIMNRLDVNPAKVTVIPVGLGEEFKPQPLTDSVRHRYGLASPYILYLGNFKPHKNLPRLLRAYAGLPEPLKATYQLVLAGGNGDHRPVLESLARRLDVADRVLFAGRIEDTDLPAVYGESALFVLPSLDEGFGLPALEAMACGAPVVASDRAALPEVVGDAALLVDPEDEATITTAMTRALTTDRIREHLRRRGLLRARDFSPDRTANRVLALLRAVSEAR
ncbi:MAG: glycosyltransferase family 4 protein [Acidobacteriota bacterium]